MKTIDILIIEDKKTDIESYKDNLNIFNEKIKKEENIEIKCSYIENYIDGINKIKSDFYDSVIIDLKLSTTNEYEGNNIVKEISSNYRYPIFIYTANPGSIDEEITENCFRKIKVKTNVTITDIYEEILKIYKTGITKILGGKGDIETYLNEIFWKHLSNNFESYCNIEDSEKVLLRQISFHLSEYLDETPEKYHPFEMYIIPPIKIELFTGCILKSKNDSDSYFIILMPACDMVIRSNGKRKAKKIVICEIENPKDSYIYSLKGEINKLKENREDYSSKNDELKELLKNNSSLKYHYLSENNLFKGGLINFQKINSLSETEIKKNYDVIGKITEPFLKDIIARFSQYYSRQGQPDFDVDKILESILSK